MVRRIPAQDRLVEATGSVELLDGDALTDLGSPKEKSRFRMTAYTGATVKRWYGDLVIDLAGLAVASQKVPILLEHDREKRVGFSDGITKAKTLEITGQLLANDHGRGVALDSGQGFPFQASVGVAFDEVLDVAEGHVREVNGREVRGPCMVATKSRLLESSFVALGADGATSAEAFSRESTDTIEVKETKMTEPVDPEAARAAAVKSERERLAAIKAALPGRPELAIERFEAGDTPEAAKVLGDVLAREETKHKAALDAAKKGATVKVVPLTAAREEAGAAPEEAPTGLAKLAPETIADLASEDVEKIARDALAEDKALRKEFKGDAGALAAFARMDAAGRVSILEPLHGKYGR